MMPSRPRSPGRGSALRGPGFALRGWAICALLAACLALWNVPPAHAQGPYRIGPGDVLAVTVFGQEGLSGRFKVSADGAISYPLVGEIAVSGLTRPEIEAKVSLRLAEQVPTAGGISVDIAEYAPVFIIGDVMRPGRYEFRPGMIALELLAVGGGLERARLDQTGDPILQMINLERDLYDLRIVRFGQAAQRGRLTAEIAGEDFTGEIDPAEDQPIAGAQKVRTLDNERALFTVRASVLANRERALKQQHANFDQEIKALTEGIRLHDQEMALVTRQLNSAQGLAEKGLTTEMRVISLQRELTATRRSAVEQQSFLARARQNQLAVALQIEELRNTRANALALELRDLDLAIARANESLATLASSLAEMQTRGSARVAGRAGTIRYEVVRLVEGQHVTLPITERDPLKPRDILQVTRQP
ncbi:MAG: polysaccharide biosynthesis/export family protein, partial [Rhodospirillales bacterium]|nr:polysaccharide biosynthesis/export family protein [Rhodospirillales bacterium]